MSDEAQKGSSGTQEPVEPILPPQLRAYIDKASSIWARMPMTAKLFIGAIGLTVALVGAYIGFEPLLREDAVLFSQLESEDAGTIVDKLKTLGVPFELTGDGTTIRVPEDRVHELRLSLAAEGLPRGGQVGFETFENMRLGATEFEQQVTYRRAMEGELARTITTVSAVKSARVHLVMPRKSVFAQKSEPASASVVVKLVGTLQRDEIAGVINLVASAVPGLDPEAITLVTTDGNMLHRPRPQTDADGDGMSAADADQVAHTRALEALLEERTRTMLERVLGPGHVDVRIAAEMDTAKVETKSDHYEPEKTAMRSEQAMEERVGGGGQPDTVAGVPGAEANLPGGEAIVGEAADAQGAAGILRKSHTRNFEVDRVQERRVSVTQDVKRLAVAVIIDGVKQEEGGAVIPRTDEELAKLEKLVKSAVGFDDKRGDEVTVASVPFFIETLPDEAPEPDLLPIPDKYKPLVDKWGPLAKVGGAALLGLILVLWVRRKVKKAAVARTARLKELKAAESATAALEAAKTALATKDSKDDGPVPIDYRVEALGRAQLDPATAAMVLRNWLGSGTTKQNASDKAA